ncbi:MAG: GlxA family transcriptional regulator, partial [Acidimicrobiales bacterium]
MRTIVLLMFEGFQPLDLAGPHEVFAGANVALDRLDRLGERYRLTTVALEPERPVYSESGLAMMADTGFTSIAEIDTLLIPGGDGVHNAAEDDETIAWLATTAQSARRVAAVCTGTFLAARAGLCDGHKVTTHWASAGRLATQYPGLDVDPDSIYVRDEELWTSAGVTAGIDLALALVDQDCGADIAQLVARHLVVYLRRPGGQTQYAAPVWADATELMPIRTACDLVHSTPEADHSVAILAQRVGLSTRHFTRLFKGEIGESPARYIERVRTEAARSLLETESIGLEQVALRSGFGSAETLRRAFHRRLGVSPAAY